MYHNHLIRWGPCYTSCLLLYEVRDFKWFCLNTHSRKSKIGSTEVCLTVYQVLQVHIWSKHVSQVCKKKYIWNQKSFGTWYLGYNVVQKYLIPLCCGFNTCGYHIKSQWALSRFGASLTLIHLIIIPGSKGTNTNTRGIWRIKSPRILYHCDIATGKVQMAWWHWRMCRWGVFHNVFMKLKSRWRARRASGMGQVCAHKSIAF